MRPIIAERQVRTTTTVFLSWQGERESSVCHTGTPPGVDAFSCTARGSQFKRCASHRRPERPVTFAADRSGGLLEKTASLERTNAEQGEEIARLKGSKVRPNIRRPGQIHRTVPVGHARVGH